MRMLLFPSLLAACAPYDDRSTLTPGTEPPPSLENPRPDDAPDVVVFSFSGHDARPTVAFNADYLADQGAAPVQIAEMFQDRGFNAEVFAYGDEFYNRAEGHWGFLGAVSDMLYVAEEWIADFDNPTRVIVVGHSHGGVWAHTVVGLVGAPVDVLVSLDAVSEGWETPGWTTGYAGDNWQAVIDDYNATNGLTFEDWGFDFAELGEWYLPGIAAEQTIDDVVFSNVGVNLEYQSSSPIVTLSDWEANHRLDDGSVRDIVTSATGELHGDNFGGGIAAPDSIATRHAVDSIEALYFQ